MSRKVAAVAVGLLQWSSDIDMTMVEKWCSQMNEKSLGKPDDAMI